MAVEQASSEDQLVQGGLIEAELVRWGVPGIEVAVVRDDEVVFAGGFGAADRERDLPVTPTTLFQHGSTGKTLTALLAAILVDEGLLEWDRPVRDYLPDFRLWDEVLTSRVTIRDLLAHRTGVARHEFMWVANTSWDRAELVRRLRYLEPARDLRTEFLYWNPGYAAAGLVMGAVTGSTWEEQIRARVFEPLGMTSATTSIAEARETGEFARPYELRGGEIVDVGDRVIEACAPAGQIMYCAVDSARWLRFQANGGELDGRRLVSEEALAQMFSVQIPVELPGPIPDHPEWGPSFHGLGLGPAIGVYRDRRMIYSSGGIDGFRTNLAVLPEQRIGVLASSNRSSGLPFALIFHLVDLLLGVEPHLWFDRLHELEEKQLAEAAKVQEVTVVPGTSPSHPLEDFAGEYEHPGYGILVVSTGPAELTFRLGDLSFTSTYRHYDTWTVYYEPFDESVSMTFVTNADGDVAEVVAPLEASVPPIRFTRRTPVP